MEFHTHQSLELCLKTVKEYTYPMQNIHTHTWDSGLHFRPETVREADLSRGYPLDLTVRLAPFMEDMAPFERVVVFGLKARGDRLFFVTLTDGSKGMVQAPDMPRGEGGRHPGRRDERAGTGGRGRLPVPG